MGFYPSAVNALFEQPRNIGIVEQTPARGRAASFECGAALRLTLRLEPPAYRVTEAKFQAAGCGYLIAAVSALTEMLKGLNLNDLETIAARPELCEKLLNQYFDSVPADRQHCLTLCREALADAVATYRRTAWRDGLDEAETLICVCFGVPESVIRQTINAGAETVAEVTAACHAGAGCGSCRSLIQDFLDES